MKTAVVLLNLGAPDAPSAVRPFLQAMFRDPAILSVPQPFRWMLAEIISRSRASKARAIYARIGGGSPLRKNTEAQAAALEKALGSDFKVFVSMRYWHPRSDEAARAAKAYGAERVILLPLYPQFSTTTSASSIRDWKRAAAKAGLSAATSAVCCYPQDDGWIAAQADLVRAAYDKAAKAGKPRILFSAHGLPKKVIAGGDPYQWQVEQTAAAVVARLAIPGLDWAICYQSRVGPLEWIGPSTEEEIARGGADRVPLVITPIAFVSEHSETLVELDIEYRERAHHAGVPAFERVPAVATHPAFIAGLANLVRASSAPIAPGGNGKRLCPAGRTGCPCAAA